MKDGIIKTCCGLCHAGCGMLVTIKDGRIAGIEADRDHPLSKGYLCKKALAVPELLSSPQRLVKPLKKVGDRQVEIGWDEAYDLAADNIRAVSEKYGPQAVLRCSGAPVNYDARDGLNGLMSVIGSASATGSASQCSVPRSVGRSAVVGSKGEPDFDRAELIVLWGANPQASNRLGGFCGYERIHELVHAAVARGCHVVCIDPVKSETAALCSEWVQIKCGSDAALGLAMISHIIRNGLYDSEFVEKYTLGFDSLAEHVRDKTPEWAAPLTGLSAGDIRRLAELVASVHPAAICDGNGLDQYCNVVDTSRIVASIIALTGNLEVPGGTVTLPFIPQSRINSSRARCLPKEFPLFAEIPFIGVKNALLRGDADAPRAMLVHHANPMLIHANPERTRQALEKLDFLMAVDIFPTATTAIADLVLPAASYFEHYAYRAVSGFEAKSAFFARPIADAPGGVKSVFETEYEIARRLGKEALMPYRDDRSWIDFMLAPASISFDELNARQYISIPQKPEYRAYERSGFATASGKVEFRSERFGAAGLEPLPVYRESAGAPIEKSAEYPMTATSRRPGDFVHTKLHNLSYLTLGRTAAEMWISPADAKRCGLEDGALASVSTPLGSRTFAACVKPEQQEGLVALEFGWGNPTDPGADMNALISDSLFDPAAGTTPNRLFACRVQRVADQP